MRRDHKVVKALHRLFGPGAAKAWQRVPYVEIESHANDAKSRLERKRGDVLGEETFPIPWDCFVVQIDLKKGSEYFVYVSRKFPMWLLPHVKEEETRQPPIVDPEVYLVAPVHPGTVLVFTLGRKPDGKPGTILFTGMQVVHEQDRKELNAFGITVANVVERTVETITESPGHLTEITPSSPKCSAKTIKMVPWIRDDLSRIILLDPARAAKTYGMPTGRTLTERHAPVPHGRRGHWRRLSDERRTWVRPAWIGPTEWESSGQIYRVLSPPSATL